MVKLPRLKLIQCFACPEGCRKKFGKVRDVNHHLTKVHGSNYKIFLYGGRCYFQPKRGCIMLVPTVRVKAKKVN